MRKYGVLSSNGTSISHPVPVKFRVSSSIQIQIDEKYFLMFNILRWKINAILKLFENSVRISSIPLRMVEIIIDR